MKQACKYNIIRFQPYAETQEFANIGIVLYVPLTNTLVFKLLPARQYGRITHFFDTLDKRVFQDAVMLIREELTRIQKMLVTFPQPNALYNNLVEAREDIVNYSEHYTRFTEDPVATVTERFEYYVQRRFTQQKGHEKQMQERISQLLQTHHLAHHFKQRKLGNKHYEVYLPFVTHQEKEAIPAIIKPIHFRHTDSRKLMNHGIQWIGTMNQLFRHQLATPERTLFTYKAPDTTKGLLYDAFEDIKTQIKDQGIQMLPIDQQAKTIAFAQDVTT